MFPSKNSFKVFDNSARNFKFCGLIFDLNIMFKECRWIDGIIWEEMGTIRINKSGILKGCLALVFDV